MAAMLTVVYRVCKKPAGAGAVRHNRLTKRAAQPQDE